MKSNPINWPKCDLAAPEAPGGIECVFNIPHINQAISATNLHNFLDLATMKFKTCASIFDFSANRIRIR